MQANNKKKYSNTAAPENAETRDIPPQKLMYYQHRKTGARCQSNFDLLLQLSTTTVYYPQQLLRLELIGPASADYHRLKIVSPDNHLINHQNTIKMNLHRQKNS